MQSFSSSLPAKSSFAREPSGRCLAWMPYSLHHLLPRAQRLETERVLSLLLVVAAAAATVLVVVAHDDAVERVPALRVAQLELAVHPLHHLHRLVGEGWRHAVHPPLHQRAVDVINDLAPIGDVQNGRASYRNVSLGCGCGACCQPRYC